MKNPKKEYSNQFATQRLREEEIEEDLGGSVTGTGTIPGSNNDSYLPGSKKKQPASKISKTKDKEHKLAAGKSKGYKTGIEDWSDAPSIPNRASKGGFIYKDLWKEANLNESYSKFKKETRTRDGSQQYHEAVKLVRKKLDEINKILEYSKRLKEEMPYQNTGMYEAKSHTKKAIQKIKEQVAEAYKKIKKLAE
jgi:hypothetical protein